MEDGKYEKFADDLTRLVVDAIRDGIPRPRVALILALNISTVAIASFASEEMAQKAVQETFKSAWREAKKLVAESKDELKNY